MVTLHKSDSIILFGDIIGTKKQMMDDETGFVGKYYELCETARNEFQLMPHGNFSQIICVYDNVWARVNADKSTEAHSPDNQVTDLLADVLVVSFKIARKAKQLSIPIVQVISHGDTWHDADTLCYPINSVTAMPECYTIASLGKPQIQCNNIIQTKNIKSWEIAVDVGAFTEENIDNAVLLLDQHYHEKYQRTSGDIFYPY